MYLAPELVAEILTHVTALSPMEGCGLLAMDGGDVVRRVYCLDNVADSPVRFTVDPDGHFAALGDAEANGWRIGGVFHSHPRSAAVPSRTDIAGALDPEWVHLIIGLTDATPEIRAWWIRRGQPAEVPVTVGEERLQCR
ncbi:MAG: M67 family metallopeptidase [Acidimicrobiia bacterium]|nr:M67 family metallopeptidase [Acidimicrobiia bacterium]